MGRSLERLQTGQSEPMRMRSVPKDSMVVSIHGLRELTAESAGRPAMMPETLQTTLGRLAIFFKEVAHLLKFFSESEGPPQWSRTNWVLGHDLMRS